LWTEVLSRTSVSTSVSSLADIDAAPVIDQNRVYAVGEGGRMVSLELTTGKRLWEQNLAGVSTPWIAGEWVFVVTEEAKLYCLSRANGKIRWISDLGGFKNMKKRKNPINWTGPVLAGGRLILLNSEGQIVSVSPSTGEKGDVMKGSSTFGLPPVVANNILYTIDSKGRISAYR
jgi:outer membrane protein assembly factor BamB